MAGRPTKLTPELQKEFLRCLKLCCWHNYAAAQSGIDPDTLREWVKRGARYKDAEPKERKTGDKIYFDFLMAVRKVEAEIVTRSLSTIRRAGEDVYEDITAEQRNEDGSLVLDDDGKPVRIKIGRKLVRTGNAYHLEWFLERWDRKNFGYKADLNLEMQGANKLMLDVAKKVLSEDDYARLLGAIAEAGSEEAPGQTEGEEEA